MADTRSALAELTLARLREFVREPAALFWVFVFPLLLAVALGVAFRNRPPEPARVVLVSPSLAALSSDAELVVEQLPEDQAVLALRHGKVDLVVDEQNGQLRYRFDATRPEARHARLAAERAIERMRGRTDVTHPIDEPVTERGSRYIDFLLPGLIGMNLLGSSMWGTGWVVVDARKRKLLKRLAATPMRRRDYLLSLVAARLVFLVAEIVVLVGVGRFVFGVEVQGSLLAVGALSFLGSATFTGMALLIAARPKTTEAASGLFNAAQMPMWLLSGTFFSAERFPAWLQPVVQALPLTALNDALRAVINEGATLASQAHELALLGAWAVVSLALAARLFRWQ